MNRFLDAVQARRASEQVADVCDLRSNPGYTAESRLGRAEAMADNDTWQRRNRRRREALYPKARELAGLSLSACAKALGISTTLMTRIRRELANESR